MVHMKRPELQALGNRIRTLRLQRGMTQEVLADNARLHRTYVGGIERGERNVAYLNLLAIAQALNVPVARLLPKDQHKANEQIR